jgi:hypothetical protein
MVKTWEYERQERTKTQEGIKRALGRITPLDKRSFLPKRMVRKPFRAMAPEVLGKGGPWQGIPWKNFEIIGRLRRGTAILLRKGGMSLVGKSSH